MRSLTYFVAVSLDGFIAAPDGRFDAFPVEGDHIDAYLRDWTDTFPKFALDHLGATATNRKFDTVLMGWNTYAAGLGVTDDPYPHLDQYVFSRQQRTAPGHITVTDADPRTVVADLKDQPGGDLWLCGGGALAGQLMDDIDRLVLKTNPVVLGDGIGLFAGTSYRPESFELTASTSYQSGVVVNEYSR